jgi:hypothetical protein
MDHGLHSMPSPPGVNLQASSADTERMSGPILISYVLFWATLMRALLVKARVLPPTCARCGLIFERTSLGERVCHCHDQ